jgi:hypothetical protein
MTHSKHKSVNHNEPISTEKLFWRALESYREKSSEEDESNEGEDFGGF